MSSQIATSRHTSPLIAFARFMVAVLVGKVLVSILAEYRWYFPANFDAAFLVGRRDYFTGVYAVAFYSHIISGPLTIVLGTLLLWSGWRARFPRLHRWAGRTQVLLVVLVLVPSGLVMARHALTGPIAGTGFALHALAMAACAIAVAYTALRGQWNTHQHWANRCLLLLVAPLIFRLVSGALIVTQAESEWAYRLNAWLSWLVPLLLYDLWRVGQRVKRNSVRLDVTTLSAKAAP
jgi:hypothetical protein